MSPAHYSLRIVSRTMELQEVHQADVGWMSRAASNIRQHWVIKMVGTTLIMTTFFVGYFALLTHVRSPVTTVPLIFIDRMIPFQPWALVLYVSLWVYVPLAPALIADRRELLSYGWATVAMSLVGFGIFILWPTAVPRTEIDWSQHPSVHYLKAVDASGNAFPSLHVAFAVFTAIWFSRLLREVGAGGVTRALNWAWCLGIIYSTLAVRQHVALDAVAGALLGEAFAIVHLRIIGPPRGA